MASVVRMMEPRDMEAVMALNKGEFPPNFLSIVYERDGGIIGWACCSVEGGMVVAHAAFKKRFSVFAVRSMAESFENFLRSFGLYFYVFGVHVKRKGWIGIIEKLAIFERYANKGMHVWFKRRLR